MPKQCFNQVCRADTRVSTPPTLFERGSRSFPTLIPHFRPPLPLM